MKGCAVSSERRPCRRPAAPRPAGHPDAGATVLLAMSAAFLLAGCAAHHPPLPPGGPGSGGAVNRSSERGREQKPQRPDEGAGKLPGSERVYPSQDPRNQSRPGAREAFPLPLSEPRSGVTTTPGAAVANTAVSKAAADSAVPAEAPAGFFSVQLGTSSRADAADQAARKAARFFPAVRVLRVGPLYKIRVGSWADRAEAEREMKKAWALGYHHAFVVTPPPERPGNRKP